MREMAKHSEERMTFSFIFEMSYSNESHSCGYDFYNT